jgi:hypothetical protein
MSRALTLLLASLAFSSAAFAWQVPIHKCSFPDEPGPAPIPCSYSNDGQSWSGTVTSSSSGIVCSGLDAPDQEEEALVAALEDLGLEDDEAPLAEEGLEPLRGAR